MGHPERIFFYQPGFEYRSVRRSAKRRSSGPLNPVGTMQLNGPTPVPKRTALFPAIIPIRIAPRCTVPVRSTLPIFMSTGRQADTACPPRRNGKWRPGADWCPISIPGEFTFPEQGEFVDTRVGKTTAVGTFDPNGYGIYDIGGNLREWTWDWVDSALNLEWKETFPDSNGYYDLVDEGNSTVIFHSDSAMETAESIPFLGHSPRMRWKFVGRQFLG